MKLIATKITIAAGGSAGKEGPCAQIGGGLSSLFADLLKLQNASRLITFSFRNGSRAGFDRERDSIVVDRTLYFEVLRFETFYVCGACVSFLMPLYSKIKTSILAIFS